MTLEVYAGWAVAQTLSFLEDAKTWKINISIDYGLKTSTRSLYDAGWRSRQTAAREKGISGKYVGRGRFSEKGGGQQVGSAFQASSDNEKIKALYGNYGFWSWLRYWYLDSADFITLMLIDKGYYDYDYQEPKRKRKRNISKATDPEKLARKLGQLGIATKPQPLTPEEVQRIAMEEVKTLKAAKDKSNNNY